MRIAKDRPGPHAVYRLWAKDGSLLYVGCSFRPFNRLKSHEAHQVWAAMISSVTMEWFPDRATALAAELDAIRIETPEWNVHAKRGEKKHTWGRLAAHVDLTNPDTWVRKARGAA